MVQNTRNFKRLAKDTASESGKTSDSFNNNDKEIVVVKVKRHVTQSEEIESMMLIQTFGRNVRTKVKSELISPA